LGEKEKTYVDLPDIENFALAYESLVAVLLHRRPEDVVRLSIRVKSVDERGGTHMPYCFTTPCFERLLIS
jgi:hypothetical protein